MKILALDASTEACSVALMEGSEITERFEIAPREHARLLLPMARELLAGAQIRLQDLNAIAVTKGPGAFTGIRIAMSMAQGLALGADVPMAGVSTLASLALRNYRLHGQRKTLVVQDARMQEVYWAAFSIDTDGQPSVVNEEQVSAPSDVRVSGDGWTGAGNGWAVYPDALETLQQSAGGSPRETLPHAEDIAWGALRMAQTNNLGTADSLEPSYIRDNVARKAIDQISK